MRPLSCNINIKKKAVLHFNIESSFSDSGFRERVSILIPNLTTVLEMIKIRFKKSSNLKWVFWFLDGVIIFHGNPRKEAAGIIPGKQRDKLHFQEVNKYEFKCDKMNYNCYGFVNTKTAVLHYL